MDQLITPAATTTATAGSTSSKAGADRQMQANYNKLATLFGGSLDRLPEAAKSERPGLMAAHFDQLYPDGPTKRVVSLAHYYQQNGDAVSDPVMELMIDFEDHTLEALTYQDSRSYHRVYNQGLADPRLMDSLNEFLSTWLTNLIDQGHRFTQDQP